VSAAPQTRRNPAGAGDPHQSVTAAPARGSVPLAGAIGSYGLTVAILGTTTSLFLADAVHAGPLLIGMFFAARGAVAVVVNQAAGWISDRLPDRRVLMGLSGAAGVAGAVCFALLRNYVAALVTGALAFGMSGVAFSQLLAYANEFAKARGREVTAFTSVMRSVFSAAWVAGPPAGLFLLTRYGFRPLYLVLAGLSLLTAAFGRWLLPRVPQPPQPPRPPGAARGGWRAGGLGLPRRTWVLLGVIVIFGVVDQMYNIDIALYITKDLHLAAQTVGWVAGLGAALEIPIMIMAGRLAGRFGKLPLVVAAAAIAMAFFCLLPLATSVPALLALQVLNAAWTAVALSIPIVMVQEESPTGAGASSALYTSAFMSAVLLAGAITGVTAAAVGYRNVFWVCAGLSVAGGGLLLGRAEARRGTSTPG
jgi:MFS transporter, SET family, sugar efflux transporter